MSAYQDEKTGKLDSHSYYKRPDMKHMGGSFGGQKKSKHVLNLARTEAMKAKKKK